MSQWGESVSVDFGELQANTMAVDCLGKWAVLPGRRVLALVDLDHPTERIHRLTRQSKYDISVVQCNPHASHAHWFATACMQKLDLYSWSDGSSKQVCAMKAHSRNITDIDWSPFDVNVIASCSVDTYTLLWDIRDSKRPVQSFQSVCGASQVKWNKVTNNLFATAHEGDVRIWDPRKGNNPLIYLTAHLSKIHGLDWSPSNEQLFVTSSQDCCVKFWDYTNSRQDRGMLTSGSPVWRARFTPFGDGLVTVVMATLRRSENSLFLWNNGSLDQPVHQFIGHNDAVIDYQWRKKDDSEKDYQLVTWSRDQNLMIWKVDPVLQRQCGHSVLDSSEGESTMVEAPDTQSTETPPAAPLGSQASLNNSQSEHQPMTLYQEFSLVNKYIPNVSIDRMDDYQRECALSITSGKYVINLTISFPVNYPNAAAPMFDITPTSVVNTAMIKKLYRVLQETAQTNVKKNRNCLEPCIRQVATAFENMTLDERKTPDSDSFPPPTNMLQGSFMQLPFQAFQDFSIPFPRTCGAQFNSAGLLVCFGRSREASKSSEKTPKALSDVTAFSSTNRVRTSQSSAGFTMFSRSPPTPKADRVSISSYYMPKRKRTNSRTYKDIQDSKYRGSSDKVKKEKKSVKLEAVRVYDTHCLLNIHRELAEKYRLDFSNINAMCEHNKLEAAALGRKDLVRVWSLVPIMRHPSLSPSQSPDAETPWAQRPFGRQMLESLMDYYKKIGDVQTLAMLCCVFWDRSYFIVNSPAAPPIKKSASKASLEYVPPNYNPYHTVSSMSGLLRSLTKSIRETAKEDPIDEAVYVENEPSAYPSSTAVSPLATPKSPISPLATPLFPVGTPVFPLATPPRSPLATATANSSLAVPQSPLALALVSAGNAPFSMATQSSARATTNANMATNRMHVMDTTSNSMVFRQSISAETTNNVVVARQQTSMATSNNAVESNPHVTTSKRNTIALDSLPSKPASFFAKAMVKLKRSNSLSDMSFEDYKFTEDVDQGQKAEETERKQHENNCRLLDPAKYIQFDHILKVYADILSRWGLRNQATQVMKHVTIPPEPHSGIEFGVTCFYCKTDVRGVNCCTCKRMAFRCIICHLGVKGAANFCLNCGHGGHTSHMKEWFQQEIECPTGCGCQCMKWNPF